MTTTGLGEEYKAVNGRVRGFAPWNPQHKTLALIDTITEILDKYRDYLPITLRQLFYRLVGAHGYEKSEKAYSRLGEYMNRARRAGLIEWGAIRDDGFYRTGHLGWESVEEFQQTIETHVRGYRKDRPEGQSTRLAVGCEASGMAPQFERVCKDSSVPVYSSGGFDSTTIKHDIAVEFAQTGSLRVLHLGDHDPSGVHVFGSLDEDVQAFAEGLDAVVDFVRLAVRPEHIAQYTLPTAPPKETDRRAFVGRTVQAEARPPDILADILRNAIRESLDLGIYRQAAENETAERAELGRWLALRP